MNAPLSYSHKIIKVVFAKKSETAPTIPHFIKGIKNMKAKRVTAPQRDSTLNFRKVSVNNRILRKLKQLI